MGGWVVVKPFGRMGTVVRKSITNVKLKKFRHADFKVIITIL